MYVFAIALMLGLGVITVALVIERFVAIATELWALLLVALGVGAAWLADFSLWAAWDIPVRADWIALTLTGLAIAGLAEVWYVVLRVFRGVERKFNDQAESLEKEKGLRRVA